MNKLCIIATTHKHAQNRYKLKYRYGSRTCNTLEELETVIVQVHVKNIIIRIKIEKNRYQEYYVPPGLSQNLSRYLLLNPKPIPNDCLVFCASLLGLNLQDVVNLKYLNSGFSFEEITSINGSAVFFQPIIFYNSPEIGVGTHYGLYIAHGWVLSKMGVDGELEISQMDTLHHLYKTCRLSMLLPIKSELKITISEKETGEEKDGEKQKS